MPQPQTVGRRVLRHSVHDLSVHDLSGRDLSGLRRLPLVWALARRQGSLLLYLVASLLVMGAVGCSSSDAPSGGDENAVTSADQDSHEGDAGSGSEGAGGPDAMGGREEGDEESNDEQMAAGMEESGGEHSAEESHDEQMAAGMEESGGEHSAEESYDEQMEAGMEESGKEHAESEEDAAGAGMGGEGYSEEGGMGAGGSEGMAGGGAAPKKPVFPEDSPEYAVVEVIWQVGVEGKVEGLAELISPEADGLLADLRSGELSDEKLAEAKKILGRVQKVGSTKTVRGMKQIILRNDQKQILQFMCKRTSSSRGYRIEKLTVRDAPTKSGRR